MKYDFRTKLLPQLTATENGKQNQSTLNREGKEHQTEPTNTKPAT